MILPLVVACGKTEDKTDVDADKYYYDDSTRERAADSIPEDYDLENQTIGFFYPQPQEKFALGDGETTDIIYSRIHERNLSVEERLNVDIDFISSGVEAWQDCSEVIKQDIQTMSAAWEVCFAQNNMIIQQKLFNYFHDLNDSEYIDVSDDWWYEDAIMETSVDNYNYRFLHGDIGIYAFGLAGATFYNKALYEQYISPGNPDELYQKVLDGKWTLEEFTRLVKKCYIDKGGNGENNIYGFVPCNGAEIQWLRESVGIRGYERDAIGMPKFDLLNDKCVEFANILYSLYFENEGTSKCWPGGDAIENQEAFCNGKYLFQIRQLNRLLTTGMREMKDDFGVIPCPKWDENQEEYINLIHSSSTTVCCPISADIDRVNNELSAVIEALASESYRKVYTAYYESALKSAYNRDDLSAQMIDIITGQHATVKSVMRKNFIHEFNDTLGGMEIHYSMIGNRHNNYASLHDSLISSAGTKLNELIKSYKDGKI
jgi:hypothetical protein